MNLSEECEVSPSARPARRLRVYRPFRASRCYLLLPLFPLALLSGPPLQERHRLSILTLVAEAELRAHLADRRVHGLNELRGGMPLQQRQLP